MDGDVPLDWRIEALLERRQLPIGMEVAHRVVAERTGATLADTEAAIRVLAASGQAASDGHRVIFQIPLTRSTTMERSSAPGDCSTGNPDPNLLLDWPVSAGADPRERLYGEPRQFGEFVELGRRYHTEIGVGPGPTTVTSGAIDAIERLLSVCAGPGDAIAVENPTYPNDKGISAALGLRLLPVLVDHDGPVIDSVAEALARGTRVLLLRPRGQNPTGSRTSPQRAERLRALLARHPGVLVVEDDHLPWVDQARYATATTDRHRWAVITSLSKVLGPDIRLAWLSCDDATARRVEGRRLLGSGWVSRSLQVTAHAALTAPTAKERLAAAADTYATRRLRLTSLLRDAGYDVTIASGFNAWIPVRDESTLVERLADAGWIVAPGRRYWLEPGPAGIRVTFAHLPEASLRAFVAALAAADQPTAAVPSKKP
ncbi:aminotransferase class I/II-fold pyridoxal phosphate-dependent enzyme [Nonomuraea sp. NPDC050786]|uniref:aminotransferase class I/II-fold pyridoxal phosphate-dependent enzyme n=1 Tax=Nonomuraea sp. NPDC050786 TaxID=3154840 RepID=UPI0033ECCE28